MENPMTTLRRLKGVVVIDEAQRMPDVFPILRVLADRERNPATFLILGSASPELSRQALESLAGRVYLIEMRGFGCHEIEKPKWNRLWLRGGFPRSFLAQSDLESFRWRHDFIQTFLERDLANLGFGMAPSAMRRFWRMVSHYHAQIWNASEVASSMGVSPNTARHYLDALEQTYMIRRLPPWFKNLGKRLVKTPKLYFRDPGLFHSLQGIDTLDALHNHPKLGASWEGFILEQILESWKISEPYFHAVHNGSELDLFFQCEGRRVGVEIKWSDAPRRTRSMQVVIDDLKLHELKVIYPGTRTYAMGDKITAVPFAQALSPNA